jgi:hypothetical protein
VREWAEIQTLPRATEEQAISTQLTLVPRGLAALGITDYLKSDGTLGHAQAMANRSSPRTTKLDDRRSDETSLDEYEKVGI